MDFYSIFKLLLRKKWYLIIIPLVAIIISIILTRNMPPEFKSTAKIATGYTTNTRVNISEERFNVRDGDVKFSNLIQDMTSEIVVSMLSYNLMLHDLTNKPPFRKLSPEATSILLTNGKKETIDILKKKISAIELLSNYDPKEKQLLNMLASMGYANWILDRGLKVNRVEQSDFVSVQYLSEDPFLSAYIVNKLSQEAIRYDNHLRENQADQSVTFFANLVEEKKKALDESMALLTNVKRPGQTFNAQEQSEKISKISDNETRRVEILSNINRLNLLIESLDKRINDIPSISQRNQINANIIAIRKKIDDIGDREAVVNQKKIKDLSAQLQQELSKLNDVGLSSKSQEELKEEKEQYEIELQVAQNELVSLGEMTSTLKRRVSGAASSEATVEALQRQVEKTSDEYLSLVNRYNTERSKALIASPLQLAILGQPNGNPEFPKRYLIIALTGAASFGLCVFAVIVSAFIDGRIKTSDQFRERVGLPLASTINTIQAKNLNLNELFLSKKTRSLEIFKHFLRKLRYEMEESKGKVFLLTSLKPKEGKTFITICMAFTLAMIKKRVLIIDTNFRHNSLTQALVKKDASPRRIAQKIHADANTISNSSSDEQEFLMDDYSNTFVSSSVVSTTNQLIHVMGNTGCAASPAEIFAGKNFAYTIGLLRQQYDYILIEGAALNNFSDTRELADYADKVIPVFSTNSEIRSQDRESIQYLKSLNGKLMGAVLNQTNIKDIDAE